MNTYKGIGIDNTRLTCPQDIIVKVYFSHDKNGKDIVQLCYYKDHIRTVKTKTLPVTLSQKEKEAKAYEYKQNLQNFLYNSLMDTSKHNFKEELDIFIEYKRNIVKKTVALDYETKYRHIIRYFKDKNVEDIDTSDIMEFLFKDCKGLKDSTLKRYNSLLSTFLNYEVENQHNIKFNPCKGIKIAPKSTNRIDLSEDNSDKEDYLSVEEIKQLLDYLKNNEKERYPLYYVVKLAVIYGLRRGEIFGLRWKQVDFEKHTLNINNTVVITITGAIEQNSTKTKSGMRVYPLIDIIINDLQDIKDKQVEMGIYKEDGLVFSSSIPSIISSKYEFCDPDLMSKHFKRIIKKMDFIKNKDIHFHSLRHTCVNLLYYEFNFTLDQIAKWVGHSSKYISDKYYLHDNMDWKIRQGNIIDKKLDI